MLEPHILLLPQNPEEQCSAISSCPQAEAWLGSASQQRDLMSAFPFLTFPVTPHWCYVCRQGRGL